MLFIFSVSYKLLRVNLQSYFFKTKQTGFFHQQFKVVPIFSETGPYLVKPDPNWNRRLFVQNIVGRDIRCWNHYTSLCHAWKRSLVKRWRHWQTAGRPWRSALNDANPFGRIIQTFLITLTFLVSVVLCSRNCLIFFLLVFFHAH